VCGSRARDVCGSRARDVCGSRARDVCGSRARDVCVGTPQGRAPREEERVRGVGREGKGCVWECVGTQREEERQGRCR
jgi:hypothetical protein